MQMRQLKIAVVSGRYPATPLFSYENHKAYCDKWGLYYINCSWPGRHSSKFFNKIEYVLEYIDLFDYIFWMDDDAFFVDFSFDLTNYLPKGDSFLSICSSPSYKKIKTYVSSGQFFIKCDNLGKEFLQDVYNSDRVEVKEWWGNNEREVGYYTDGDQDVMVYHLRVNEKYSHYFDLHDYTDFNCRLEDLFNNTKKIFLVHFAGATGSKKAECQKAAKILNRRENLIPGNESFGFNDSVNDGRPNLLFVFYKWLRSRIKFRVS
ncbi:MAG: hypothetical protein R3175_11540 [Marinobacter sp.]|uniref:hypothetical protein n=1 Tax=Marinobacter sp. TaxID=50741 RepID=UPI00299CD5B2|nr:hypothetical protein [Marinobacter sp.]MDX1756684.1 hypothetical protein [Marinobacter sp.]